MGGDLDPLIAAAAKVLSDIIPPPAPERRAEPTGPRWALRSVAKSLALPTRTARDLKPQHGKQIRMSIQSQQTTAIDQTAGIVNLTTVLAHASGEWSRPPPAECLAGAAASEAHRVPGLPTLRREVSRSSATTPTIRAAVARRVSERAAPTVAPVHAMHPGRRARVRSPRSPWSLPRGMHPSKAVRIGSAP
jgi:hypothetical protein